MTKEKESGSQGNGNFFQKIVHHYLGNIDNLHVMIAMISYTMARSIIEIITLDLVQVRACVLQVGYNSTFCQGDGRQEEDVQGIVASIHIWEQVIKNLFPILYVLFLGAWSDIYGRKILFILSILGNAVAYVALILGVAFPQTSATTLTLSSVLPDAITGGYSAATMAIALYIADTTPAETRTAVYSTLLALTSLGRVVGFYFTGAIKENDEENYTLLLGVGGGCNLIALAYTVFFVRPIRINLETRDHTTQQTLRAAFDLSNVKESLIVFFKKREGGRRAQLLWIALMIFLMNASGNGEIGTFQLFTTSKQVGWNTSDYSYFGIYNTALYVISSSIGITILVNVFKIGDASLGILACISNISAAFVTGFANGTFMMYLGALVDVCTGYSFTVFRSMATKVAPNNELGKIFTVISIGDVCASLAFGPLYAAIYKLTVDWFPGFFLLVSAIMTIPALILCCWFRFHPLNEAADSKSESDDEEINVVSDVTLDLKD